MLDLSTFSCHMRFCMFVLWPVKWTLPRFLTICQSILMALLRICTNVRLFLLLLLSRWNIVWIGCASAAIVASGGSDPYCNYQRKKRPYESRCQARRQKQRKRTNDNTQEKYKDKNSKSLETINGISWVRERERDVLWFITTLNAAMPGNIQLVNCGCMHCTCPINIITSSMPGNCSD